MEHKIFLGKYRVAQDELELAAAEATTVAVTATEQMAPARIYRGEEIDSGRTVTVLSQDAYGHGPVARTITSIRGVVRHGDSGGPAVDASGRVLTTIFAARVGSTGGYGVPRSAVRAALAGAHGPVSSGPCSS